MTVWTLDTAAALAGSDGGGGGEGPGSTPGHWSGHNMGTRATRPAAAHPVGDFL